MVTDVEELLDLAYRLARREEPDSLYLLLKAASYNHRLLFAASDRAGEEYHSDISTLLSDAAVEALRNAAPPAGGPPVDAGPVCPDVTVDLNWVRRESDQRDEPFLKTLVGIARFLLSVANRPDAREALRRDLNFAHAQGDFQETCIDVVARYIKLTE